eukprot:Clim_evm28s239 gene=Clim_evmTU28s239
MSDLKKGSAASINKLMVLSNSNLVPSSRLSSRCDLQADNGSRADLNATHEVDSTGCLPYDAEVPYMLHQFTLIPARPDRTASQALYVFHCFGLDNTVCVHEFLDGQLEDVNEM